MAGIRAAAISLALVLRQQPVASPGQINHALFDTYSLAHAAVGLILSVLGASFGTMLFITIGWELAERVLKDLVPAIFPHPTQDTLANSIGDIGSALAAWYLYRRLGGAARGRRRSLGPIPGSRSRP
jgi:hypothetical protein